MKERVILYLVFAFGALWLIHIFGKDQTRRLDLLNTASSVVDRSNQQARLYMIESRNVKGACLELLKEKYVEAFERGYALGLRRR